MTFNIVNWLESRRDKVLQLSVCRPATIDIGEVCQGRSSNPADRGASNSDSGGAPPSAVGLPQSDALALLQGRAFTQVAPVKVAGIRSLHSDGFHAPLRHVSGDCAVWGSTTARVSCDVLVCAYCVAHVCVHR